MKNDKAAFDMSLGQKVYVELVEYLEAGNFTADTRIPSEEEMCGYFQVSRPVLRQALERLRGEGRIYSRRGAGTFASGKYSEPKLDYGALSSIPDVQACLEFRRTIESEAAAVAAAQHTNPQLDEIWHKLKLIDKAAASEESTIEHDFAFHQEIAQATNNKFYRITIAAMKAQIALGAGFIQRLSPLPHHERTAAVRIEHTAIVQAIANKNVDEARRLMFEHIAAGIRRLAGQ
jgi:GntR family transcriptional repressor for pyruvate dehydrogenase complex